MTRDEFTASILILGGAIRQDGWAITVSTHHGARILWDASVSGAGVQICTPTTASVFNAEYMRVYPYEEMLAMVVTTLEKNNDKR